MTDQTTNTAPSQPAADPSGQSVPLYRNPWLNLAIVLVGAFIDPIVFIYSLIVMWTGPFYQVRRRRPYKAVGTGFKVFLSLLFIAGLFWGYGDLIKRFQTVGCSSPQTIELVKQLAKRRNLPPVINYDHVQIEAVRTIANDRPNGGATCAARMTNIDHRDRLIKEADITYTIDVTDKRDEILVNLIVQ